jgi:DNA ligase (NAD+)
MKVMFEEKLDGVSLQLTYIEGQLVSGVTRGDGNIGEDVTENIAHIPSIPKTIGTTGREDISGEVVLTHSNFDQFFKPMGKKNTRNCVGPTLQGKTRPELLKHFNFVAYGYHGPLRGSLIKTQEEMLVHLHSRGFDIPQLAKLLEGPQQLIDQYKLYDTQLRNTLPYTTDGVVLKVNDLEQQEALGSSNGRPVWAVAVKPTPMACVAKVIDLEWEQGLSGRFTPVAKVEPTPLGDVTLRQINMHNLDYLSIWTFGGYVETLKKEVQGGFGIGAEVLVIRSGDVIPYLVDIINPAPTV